MNVLHEKIAHAPYMILVKEWDSHNQKNYRIVQTFEYLNDAQEKLKFLSKEVPDDYILMGSLS